jgi:hypothetical protein
MTCGIIRRRYGARMSEKKNHPADTFSHHRFKRLFDWSNCTERPAWIDTAGVHLISILILRAGDDHPISDSMQTLAEACACSYSHMRKKVIPAFESKRWIEISRNRGGSFDLSLTNRYLDYLQVPNEVTPEAVALATWFSAIQNQYSQRGGFSKRDLRQIGKKAYPDRQRLNAARIIRKCQNVARAKNICMFAVNDQKYQKASVRSLYNIRRFMMQKPFQEEFLNSKYGAPYRLAEIIPAIHGAGQEGQYAAFVN